MSASQALLDVWIQELAVAVHGSGSQGHYCLSTAFPHQKNNGLENRAAGKPYTSDFTCQSGSQSKGVRKAFFICFPPSEFHISALN